jgi:hypothetical protein
MIHSSQQRGHLYRKLPLWRDVQHVMLEVEQAVRQFPRDHKYTVGSEMRQQAMQINRLLARAVQSDTGSQRLHWIEQRVWKIEDFKMSLQLGKDLAAFTSFAQFQSLAERAVALGKHRAGGRCECIWVRYSWLAHWFAVDREGCLQLCGVPVRLRVWRSNGTITDRYPNHALLVQVGSCWECAAGPLATRRTQRRGLPPTASLPAWRVPALRRCLRKQRLPWCEVGKLERTVRAGPRPRQLLASHDFPHPQAMPAPLPARSFPCAM